MDSTPLISKGLVEWLSKVFPDRCPTAEMSDRQVWMAAGAAQVVRKLAHEHDTQAQTALENVKTA